MGEILVSSVTIYEVFDENDNLFVFYVDKACDSSCCC